MTPNRRSNIEILIPTFNEAVNLPYAIESVRGWADAIRVVDSESTDATRRIAEELGAEVTVQAWLGYAGQKNWALDTLPWGSDWIFILDADEVILPSLRDELLEIAQRPVEAVPEAGFYINRYLIFMGRRIRHCGYYPSWNLRFFRRGRARYEEREVHEHMMLDGAAGKLRGHMEHHDRRGLEHFIAKHNRYSTLEARELVRGSLQTPARAQELERGIRMRRWLKHNVLPRLPLLGFWRFFYMYVLRLGFLDGVAGFRFSLLLGTYDFFIALKIRELRQLGRERLTEALVSPPAGGALAAPEGTTPTALRLEAPSAPLAAPPKVAPTPPAVRLEPGGDRRAFGHTDLQSSPRPPVSVVVLCHNEEVNIRACLESCSWCDDVHVLDSGSSDRTREIAEEMGARVWVNPFRSFGQQRNWAIDTIPTRHRWHFHLDADERFTPALVEEMGARVEADEALPRHRAGRTTAYQCPSMMMFMGRWLRRAAEYPVYQVRLFDSTMCRYEDYGHGQREVNRGATGVLEMPYLHYNFSKGVEEWFEKHNRYSTLEAAQSIDEPTPPLLRQLRELFRGDSIARRRRLKAIAYRLPAKSTLIYLYIVLLRRGFLDGAAGINYARMRSIYEAMISVKAAVGRAERRARGSADGDE
jgi:glycosyltransferase involved in cell wall biosynthesis